MKIILAESQHMPVVRELFREYQSLIEAECCFQGFEEELANLPGPYASPKGAIYLAYDEDLAVACIAIRPTKDHPEVEVELKRLYVKDSYRNHGIGKELFNTALQYAKDYGYEAVVLETLPKMKEAQFLYRDQGFVQIPNYSDSADEGVESYRYTFNDDA